MYENDGFIINFFSEKKVNSLLKGFKNLSTTNFEEGNFPRKLFLIQNKKLYVQAGGGVVYDSKPGNEYKETINKSMAVIKAAEIVQGNIKWYC